VNGLFLAASILAPLVAVGVLLWWAASPSGLENDPDAELPPDDEEWLAGLRAAVDEGRAGTLRSTS